VFWKYGFYRVLRAFYGSADSAGLSGEMPGCAGAGLKRAFNTEKGMRGLGKVGDEHRGW
jgi:hypothetical protein